MDKPEKVTSKLPFFSVTRNEEGELVVHSIVPDGIKVSTGAYGRCLVATKLHPAGSSLYHGFAALIDTSINSDVHYLYLYDHDHHHDEANNQNDGTPPPHQIEENHFSPAEVFRLNGVHSVKDHTNSSVSFRQVYGFDGFMNHSCDASVYCPLIYCRDGEMCYDTIALRDIKPGDELTCDYATFDYDCDGHEIEVCGCKAPSCRGKMTGFKDLTLTQKVDIMSICEPEILETFFSDNPEIVCLESTIPSNQIRLASGASDESLYIVAAKEFQPGDLIFTNHATLISSNDFIHQTFILKLFESEEKDNVNNQENNKERVFFTLLDKDHHFICRPNYVESLGFDSFMDHSCSANAEQQYESDTTYSVYAARAIQKGEKITCDYFKLDNQAKNEEHIPMTSFLCQCGEENCRTEIIS